MRRSLALPLSAILAAGVMSTMIAPAGHAQVVVGYHHPYQMETPHPYRTGVPDGEPVSRHIIHHEGATYIAVHFERFDLGPGDSVVISSVDDPYSFTFTGKGVLEMGAFWATHVYGDTAVVELLSDSTAPGFGYVIDKYSAGFLPLGPMEQDEESLCGADDKDHVICWADSEPVAYDRTRAVAALLAHLDLDDPGLDRFCTGSLVSCGGLLLTNQHCVPGAVTAANTTFEFMAEALNCGDPNPPEGRPPNSTDPPYPGIRFTGGIQVASDVDLDYSLIQVNGNPHLLFGSLAIENRSPIVDERIYIPQHPLGRGKQFGIESTHATDPSGFCEVFSLNESGCEGRPGPDVGYFCDTNYGSSGSPVLAYDVHRIVALHHCGRCPNRAVPIPPILGEIQAQIGPLQPAMPGEVPSWAPDALRVEKSAANTGPLLIRWASAAEAQWYNLYRGTLANLHDGIYDHVADPANPVDSIGICDWFPLFYEDADDVATAGNFYYLVTGENPCGEGPTGYASNRMRRPDGAGCP